MCGRRKSRTSNSCVQGDISFSCSCIHLDVTSWTCSWGNKKRVKSSRYTKVGKRKDNPNNYRAITLSSIILKLYKLVLLDRCQQAILDSISRQEGGFQKQLACNMSTFVFRETLHWDREQSATVYVCCLNGRQAFDNVLQDGLFYMLIKLGLDNSTLLALRAMY